MAIGVIFDGSGMSQEQYEQVNQLASRDALPRCRAERGGFSVIEDWESQEALQEFFA